MWRSRRTSGAPSTAAAAPDAPRGGGVLTHGELPARHPHHVFSQKSVRRILRRVRWGLRVALRWPMLSPMGVIEFECERTIKAPVEEVFARLADINGHNDWMPQKGSILRHTRQTSPGEPAVGTTFLDDT